jgi:hypothetical protein
MVIYRKASIFSKDSSLSSIKYRKKLTKEKLSKEFINVSVNKNLRFINLTIFLA